MAISGLDGLSPSPGVNKVRIVPVGVAEEVEKESPKISVEIDNPKNPARKEVNRYHRITDPAKELARPLSVKEEMAGLKAIKIRIGTRSITRPMTAFTKFATSFKGSGKKPPRIIPKVNEKSKNKYGGILVNISGYFFSKYKFLTLISLKEKPRISPLALRLKVIRPWPEPNHPVPKLKMSPPWEIN